MESEACDLIGRRLQRHHHPSAFDGISPMVIIVIYSFFNRIRKSYTLCPSVCLPVSAPVWCLHLANLSISVLEFAVF